jgi:hypothetical protein
MRGAVEGGSEGVVAGRVWHLHQVESETGETRGIRITTCATPSGACGVTGGGGVVVTHVA